MAVSDNNTGLMDQRYKAASCVSWFLEMCHSLAELSNRHSSSAEFKNEAVPEQPATSRPKKKKKKITQASEEKGYL